MQAVDDPTYAQYSNSWESYDCGVRELIDTTDRHAGGPVLECGICLETLRYPGDDPDDPDDPANTVGPRAEIGHEKREGARTLTSGAAYPLRSRRAPKK